MKSQNKFDGLENRYSAQLQPCLDKTMAAAAFLFWKLPLPGHNFVMINQKSIKTQALNKMFFS